MNINLTLTFKHFNNLMKSYHEIYKWEKWEQINLVTCQLIRSQVELTFMLFLITMILTILFATLAGVSEQYNEHKYGLAIRWTSQQREDKVGSRRWKRDIRERKTFKAFKFYPNICWGMETTGKHLSFSVQIHSHLRPKERWEHLDDSCSL